VGAWPAVDGAVISPPGGLIDSHVHIWDAADPGSEWLRGQVELPARVGIAELVEAMTSTLEAAVLVEAASSTITTHKMLAAARLAPWPVRVIGWIDLARPGVADRLSALLDADESGALAGVRATLGIDADPGRLDEALTALAERNLVAEVLLGRRQLPMLVEFVRKHPAVPIVVDHLAALADVGTDTAPWIRALDELSMLPNAVIKVSGWRSIAPDRMEWAVTQLTQRIGAERLMFGSDWPMSARFGPHSETVAATRELLARALSDAQLAEVFAGTAQRVYGFPSRAETLREGTH